MTAYARPPGAEGQKGPTLWTAIGHLRPLCTFAPLSPARRFLFSSTPFVLCVLSASFRRPPSPLVQGTGPGLGRMHRGPLLCRGFSWSPAPLRRPVRSVRFCSFCSFCSAGCKVHGQLFPSLFFRVHPRFFRHLPRLWIAEAGYPRATPCSPTYTRSTETGKVSMTTS